MLRRLDREISSIFLLALGLRLFFALSIDAITDAGEFEYNALATRGGLGAQYAPLYPLFLRLVYSLFGAFNYHAVYVIQSIASSFVVVLLYATAASIGGRRVGLIAALIGALYPGFILYSRGILIESWSVLLVASMTAVAVGPMRDVIRAVALGFLAGLAVLLKPTYVFLLPGFLITVRKRLMLLAAFAAVLAPLTVHNSVVSGRFVPVYKRSSYDLTLDLYAKEGWRMIDLVYYNALLLYTWHPGDGGRAQERSDLEAAAVYYVRKYSYLVLLWLGCIGLARCWRREHSAVAVPALLAVVLSILITRVIEPRFRVFLEPLCIVYVSMLTARVCRAARDARGRAALQEP